jgi:hypothetical protein
MRSTSRSPSPRAVELAAGDLVSLVTCDKAQAIAADAVGLPLA